MPTSPENLAMFESDWPDADWNRGKNARLTGCLATNPRAAGAQDIEALFRAAL